MVILGFLTLLILPLLILILSSFPIALHEKERIPEKKKGPYSYLFDVYD